MALLLPSLGVDSDMEGLFQLVVSDESSSSSLSLRFTLLLMIICVERAAGGHKELLGDTNSRAARE